MQRRHFLGTLAAGAGFSAPAMAQPARGLDAAQFGLRSGPPEDQSAKLQRAIDQAARMRSPPWLPRGRYRARNLKLPAGAQLIGARGAILRAGGNGITLTQCDGAVSGTTISDAADTALFCHESRGLTLSSNTIRGDGNGGIRVWQTEQHADGSMIADNHIEDIAARAGRDGQNGNAINVFRAGNMIVRGNVIRQAAFSAIRGNAARTSRSSATAAARSAKWRSIPNSASRAPSSPRTWSTVRHSACR